MAGNQILKVAEKGWMASLDNPSRVRTGPMPSHEQGGVSLTLLLLVVGLGGLAWTYYLAQQQAQREAIGARLTYLRQITKK